MNQNNAKKMDLVLFPPTLEDTISFNHTNEMVSLGRVPYEGDLPQFDYGISPKFFAGFPDVPEPRANTYVLNIKKIKVDGSIIHLDTNYTNMRSQFALRRWIPALPKESAERKALLRYVVPIAGAMILETSDDQIVMEERGAVEIPGKYHPAPAGGCETRHWQVVPEPFRSIMGEAWEETGLLPGQDYSNVALIGIARDHTEGFNPAFTYHAKTNLKFEEVRRYADSIAPEAGEHERLLGAPVDPHQLLTFLIQHNDMIIGNGLGEILAFGHYKFGEEWLHTSLEALTQKQWDIQLYDRNFPT